MIFTQFGLKHPSLGCFFTYVETILIPIGLSHPAIGSLFPSWTSFLLFFNLILYSRPYPCIYAFLPLLSPWHLVLGGHFTSWIHSLPCSGSDIMDTLLTPLGLWNFMPSCSCVWMPSLVCSALILYAELCSSVDSLITPLRLGCPIAGPSLPIDTFLILLGLWNHMSQSNLSVRGSDFPCHPNPFIPWGYFPQPSLDSDSPC